MGETAAVASGKVRPAAGGGRWVDLDPERLPKWLNAFAVRHGGYRVAGVETAAHPDGTEPALLLQASDGTSVSMWAPAGAAAPVVDDDARPEDEAVEGFVQEALRERTIGLLLARQASVAVGIAEGPRLIESKVDTFYVQSRTAAGGWSQQRYARRRANQAKAAAEEASDLAVRLLVPRLDDLSALVAGGDRRTVDAILGDPRLAGVAQRRATRFLAVAEPRKAVLEESAGLARQVRVLVTDPPSIGEGAVAVG
jgi:hypothetical protein